MSKNPPLLEEKEKKKKKKVKPEDVIEIFTVLFIMFLATFGSFFAMRQASGTKLPMVVVISASMEPTIYRGDLLFLYGKEPELIQNGSYQGDPIGDIIVFEATWSYSGEPIVHRVIDKRSTEVEGNLIWEFRTQGDNTATNPSPDPGWVSQDDIHGVVLGKIPKVGFVKIWLAESGLTIPLIAGLSLILLISIAWDLTHPDKDDEGKEKKPKRRRSRRRELDAQDEDGSVNLGV